jgi:hypothetical protein
MRARGRRGCPKWETVFRARHAARGVASAPKRAIMPTWARPSAQGTGVADSGSSEEGTMVFRVLLYLCLMLGLAVRERVIRAVR